MNIVLISTIDSDEIVFVIIPGGLLYELCFEAVFYNCIEKFETDRLVWNSKVLSLE